MQKKYSLGFTLIEMMIVIAILGITASLVATNMDQLVPSTRLNAAAFNLQSTIVLAQSNAAISGKETMIHYDLDDQSYQLVLFKDGKPDPMPVIYLPTGIQYKGIAEVGESGKRVRGYFDVYFSPLGITRGHIVHFKNPEERIISVTVNPISGAVDVDDGEQAIDFVEKEK